VIKHLLQQAIQNLKDPIFQELKDLLRHDASFRELGVRKVLLDRLQDDLASYIAQASPECEIRLLGISMSKLADMRPLLTKKLRGGCRVKWLLLDPNSDYVEKRAMQEGQNVTAFKSIVSTWSAEHQFFVQSLSPDLKANIELRHYAEFPACFIVDNGSKMLVGFYLRSSGKDVPHLELDIKKDGAYVSFRKHFDSLWAAAERKTLPFKDRRRVSSPVERERRREVAEVA
jgi:hypothetical protein